MKIIYILMCIFMLCYRVTGLNYSRIFSPDTTVFVGDTIWVNVSIINSKPAIIKGLIYSEQIPQNIKVVSLSASINNSEYNELLFEIGSNHEICQNRIPYRWIFQTPPDYSEPGFLSPADTVKIYYALTFYDDTTFSFNNDSWYGGVVNADTLIPVFGYDSGLNITLTFKNPTSVEDRNISPGSSIMVTNYPNPFNPTTNIEFRLNNPGHIKIEVYNIFGQKIQILLDEHRNSGDYKVQFNGDQFASGIYFYRLQINNENSIGKMILLR